MDVPLADQGEALLLLSPGSSPLQDLWQSGSGTGLTAQLSSARPLASNVQSVGP